MPAGGHFYVQDDERDFYGKAYWLDYQRERGFPDVVERARTDLSERCLFWLEQVLETVRPPGRALEIGCGHGAFVSLLREVGFDAIGMELSPWIVEFARKTFGVPVLQGTLETLELEPGFTCITAFDVLEHLADPLDTVRRCARLLAPDGVLLLQTPCYRGEGPDWSMFQKDEHIYLFTEASLRDLLSRGGFNDIQIRPSFFPYDMWIAATPGKLTRDPRAEGASPDGWRLPTAFRALLDLHAHTDALQRSLGEAETDRAERFRQVRELTAQVEQLTRQLQESDADRAARLEVIRGAENQVLALHAEIQELHRRLERSALGRFTEMMLEAKADRAARDARLTAEVETSAQRLKQSEADRVAGLEALRDAEGKILTLRSEIQALQDRLELIEHSAVWRVYRTLARGR